MKTPKEQQEDLAIRQGYWRVEFMIPISKIIKWVKDKRKKPVETEWAYENCDCIPEEEYLSIPYCPIHGTKLYLKEV